jgi:hypothetical protein
MMMLMTIPFLTITLILTRTLIVFSLVTPCHRPALETPGELTVPSPLQQPI